MLPFFYFYNMDIVEFINIFKESFDELNEVVSPQTKFKELEAWTSMQALLFIVHFDDTLNFVYDAEDIANSSTIEDLFHVYNKRS